MVNSKTNKLLRQPLSLFLTIFLILKLTNAYKLNVPKVLLPFHSSKLISFTLEAKSESDSTEDLCFVWSSSRPDVVSITPIYDNQTTKFNGNDCSSRAQVSAVSKHPQRLTSIIFAKEIKTDKLIRCDVIVDQINTIRIKHTTTHLYLEDSPESFTAEALDTEGNTFSSIDGLPFEWSIINDSDAKQTTVVVDSRNVLRISKFIESEYEISESIRQLESIGLSGHKILIEGLKTGTANVQAKLIDSFYKDNLKTPLVRLVVVANILIEPSYPVYLLIGATIKYSVFLIKQTSVEKINLPSQQYFFETRNTSIANLAESDQSGSTLIGLNFGTTELVLIDRNMKEEIFMNKNLIDQKILIPPPSALVHVVQPDYLVFTIKNWRSWILEVGRQYEIIIQVYTSDRELIHVSENLKIESEFDTKNFGLLDRSKNGSYNLLNAIQKGTTFAKGYLKGTLQNGVLRNFDKIIRAEQEIELLDPIVVKPKVLIFAFSSVQAQSSSYEYQLEASGGSGAYYWQSRNTTIATINSNGVVKTSATRPGQSSILVTDTRNIDIQAKSLVYVLEPVDLTLLACPVETQTGSKLYLNIKMKAFVNENELIPVSDCSRLKFDVIVQDESVFKFVGVQASKTDGSCALLVLDALRVGKTLVRVTTDGFTHLQSNELMIGSYSELKSFKNQITLTKDSSLVVNLYDGPLFSSSVANPVDSSLAASYVSEVTISDDKYVKVESLEHDSHSNRYSYRLKCIQRFESQTQDFVKVKFLISHRKSSQNKCPLMFDYDLQVRCSQPSYLGLSQLFVNNEENEQLIYSNLNWKCPIRLSSGLVIANMDRNLNIQLLVKDSQNNLFDNFTALKLDWKVENKKLIEKSKLNPKIRSIDLSPGPDDSLLYFPTGEDSKNRNSLFYQTFETKQKSGETKLTARLYLDEKIDQDNFLISNLNIRLISDVKIQPEALVIFNHPTNIQTLSLINGSGYFHAEIDSSVSENSNLGNILKINQINENTVQVSPLINNGLSYLNIFDYCVPPQSLDLTNKFPDRAELKWEPTTTARIKVAGINTILVNYEDDKLEEKAQLKIYVQISDATGNLIQNKYFQLMNLNAKLVNQKNELLAQIEPVLQFDGLDSEDQKLTAVYTLTGVRAGLVSVQFEAQSDADKTKLIKSVLKEIQIYKPLSVEPKYVELIRGAEYQLQIAGGPSSQDSSVVYELEGLDAGKGTEADIIQVEAKGVVRAIDLGRVKVLVKSIGQACLPFSSLATQAAFRCSSENKIQKVYSQDYLIVKVVELSSISIFSPLKSIKIGNTMPVYLLGNERSLTPLNFGSCKDIKYIWRVNDHQIASLEHPLLFAEKSKSVEHVDSDDLYDRSFSLRFMAKQAGNVKLSVRVEFKNRVNEIVSLSDSIDVYVLEEAKFTHFEQEKSPDNIILMTPGTQFQISTNFDKTPSVLNYELNFFNQPASAEDQNSNALSTPFCNNNTIRITSNGLLTVENMRQNQLKYLQECVAGLLVKIQINEPETSSSSQKLTKQQSLPYLIKVKHVVYSMLHLAKNSLTKSSVLTLNKVKLDQKSLIRNKLVLDDAGIQMKWHVTYHDNLGDKFQVFNTRNVFKLNRNDLVDYSNLNTNLFSSSQREEQFVNSVESSFTLRTLKPGTFVMELTPFAVNLAESRDYIGLNIGDFGTKLDLNKHELNIGDLICLNGDKDELKDDSSLSWSSQANNILKLVPTQGLGLSSSHIGVCLSPGSTLLKKSGHLDSLHNVIEINIKPLDKVNFLNSKNIFITNAAQLSDDLHNQVEFQTGVALNQNCSAEFEILFKSKSSFDTIPFKCAASLYTQSGKKLAYLDRLLIVQIVYTNQHWACDVKFGQNSDSLLYNLMESHQGQLAQHKGESTTENEPVSIKILVDSVQSDSSLDDQLSILKTHQIPFIPAFYTQTKFIELPVTRKTFFNLIVHATSQVHSHLVITTNTPTLIQIKPSVASQLDSTFTYEISTQDDVFDLAEYASVLQQQNGKIYIQIQSTLNQQIEKIPVKFMFGLGDTSRVLDVKSKTSTRGTRGIIKSMFYNLFGFVFDYSPNQITSFLIMVSLFLITVLCILKIKSPISQSAEQIASSAAAAAVVAANAYRQPSPRVKDYSSFNPYRYFTTSVYPTSARDMRSTPVGMSSSALNVSSTGSPFRRGVAGGLNTSRDEQGQMRSMYQPQRVTPQDIDGVRLFSVDSNVMNTSHYHDANTSLNFRSPYRGQLNGFENSDNE